ncbi:hypothetical protein JX265_000383 [Neoarthrinium moseri]|uniref:Uncharacterized protein n=1 Tax=Neoarthrinium moseri TaxID=1658444 RepID=A0A9P9WYF5_9PEZI|nr:hypothetical protein JX265_000383 [Neoarthrinium moseri]
MSLCRALRMATVGLSAFGKYITNPLPPLPPARAAGIIYRPGLGRVQNGRPREHDLTHAFPPAARVASAACGTSEASTTITIRRAAEATALGRACPTVYGSVQIAPDANEDAVVLDGVETITQDLVLSGCDDGGCPNVTLARITGSSLSRVLGRFDIQGLGTLKEIEFPGLNEVEGSAMVQRLGALDTLDLGGLHTVRNLTVADIPQLYYAELGVSSGATVVVAGNGNLVLRLNAAQAADDGTIQNLDISGIGELRWSNRNQVVVDSFTLRDSRLEVLPLLFNSFGALNIRDNSKLTAVLFPADDPARTTIVSRLKSIAVTGNPQLSLNASSPSRWNDTDMLTWVWPSENMDTVLLDGALHDAFFQPFVDAHGYTSPQTANSTKPRVLQDFEIRSSVPDFHCEPIDEMRRHGVFPGRYSCNGNSVAVPNGGAADRARLRNALVLLLLSVCLVFGTVAGLS